MRRREFITLLGGAAAAWPLAARAQQADRVRRIGVLAPGTNGDPDQQSRLKVFQDMLRELGWTEGRNVRTEIRLAAGTAELFATYAAELVAARPDVLLADSTPSVAALQRETRTIPIVFARISEPVGKGFVQSLAKPGGNITGFTNLEPSVGAKWLELLKDIAPGVSRIGVVFNPELDPYLIHFFRSAESAAGKFAVALEASPVRDPSEIEAVIQRLGREPGGGLPRGPVHVSSPQIDHRAYGPLSTTRDLRIPVFSGGRRLSLLRRQHADSIPRGRRVC
jgi:putative ABC transport system substrate-binding protein